MQNSVVVRRIRVDRTRELTVKRSPPRCSGAFREVVESPVAGAVAAFRHPNAGGLCDVEWVDGQFRWGFTWGITLGIRLGILLELHPLGRQKVPVRAL